MDRGEAARRGSSRSRTALAALALAGLFTVCAQAVGAAAEVAVPPGEITMTATAHIRPSRLPRDHPAPARLRIGFQSHGAPGGRVPGIARIAIDLSRLILLDGEGLPSCSLEQLRSSYFESATTCARSLVGRGAVTSEITVPGRTPAVVTGNLRAYYSSNRGGEHILARVATGEPLPLTYVLPFTVAPQKGSFATRLVIRRMKAIRGICVPGHPSCFHDPYALEGVYGHIAAFRLTLARRFKYRGERHSFVDASCSTPTGIPHLVVPWARVTLEYENRASLQQTTTQPCRVRG